MPTPRPKCENELQLDVTENALLAMMGSLRQLTSSMLAGFPDVQRWDQTDDVIQQAAIKTLLALRESPPATRRHLENLVALQIRRTLIDLVRKYATRIAMNQQRWTPSLNDRTFGDGTFNGVSNFAASSESDPRALIDWLELHEAIDKLAEDEREVFQLIWYRSLSKEDVADLLIVDLRTVQRRWRAARESLANRYGGLPPL